MIRFGIHPSAVIDSLGELILPDCTVVEPQSVIYVGERGRVQFGPRNTIYPQVSIRVDQGWIETGCEVSIGSGTHIYEPRGGLIIGDSVLIAGGCLICGVQHGFSDLQVPMRKQAVSVGKIVIESDVWLGMGVIVMPGVTIGSGSVIGAGSFVNRDIPPRSIAFGRPCKVVRSR